MSLNIPIKKAPRVVVIGGGFAGLELANTSGETIRKCLIGLQKTAYGYKWKYK